MLGEKITGNVPTSFDEGIHTITVPLTNVPSGSYILRLETAEGSVDLVVKVVK
jgi:hypothetical protein